MKNPRAPGGAMVCPRVLPQSFGGKLQFWKVSHCRMLQMEHGVPH